MLRMHEFNLLAPAIGKPDRAWPERALGPFPAKVKVNGAIKTLDSVLNEETNFDVLLLKELEYFLLAYKVVVRIEMLYEHSELLCSSCQELVRLATLDHLNHRLDVVHCYMQDF